MSTVEATIEARLEEIFGKGAIASFEKYGRYVQHLRDRGDRVLKIIRHDEVFYVLCQAADSRYFTVAFVSGSAPQEYAFKSNPQSVDDLLVCVRRLHVQEYQKHSVTILRVYQNEDLTKEELQTLDRTVDLVAAVVDIEEIIHVVDFSDHAVHGMHRSTCGKPNCSNCKDVEGEIYLARHILNDSKQLLKVLVHEVAHSAGADGSEAHLHAMQNIWADLVIGIARAYGALIK